MKSDRTIMSSSTQKSSFSPISSSNGNLSKYDSKSNLESNELIWKAKSREDVFYSFPEVNIGEAIELLSSGVSIEKLTTGGSINNRLFKIERHGKYANFLSWVSPKKKSDLSRVDLVEVISIEMGMNHSRFAKKKSKIPNGEQRCITITYGKDIKGKTLCLIFDKVSTKELFVTGLQYFIILKSNPDPEKFNQKQYTAQLWQIANRDGDKKLTRQELFPLLKSLGYRLSKTAFKAFFNKFDSDKSGAIQYPQFVEIMKEIRVKPELEELYKKYVDQDYGEVTPDLLASFYRNVQGQLVSKDFCEQLIKRSKTLDDLDQALEKRQEEERKEFGLSSLSSNNFSPIVAPVIASSSDLGLDLFSFGNIIFSNNNLITNPEVVEEVCDDMTRPLTHYFINSSHNTYLVGGQFIGKSSVQMYRDVLISGARCVELDCVDGSNGDPVVTHKGAAVNSLPMAKVLEAIKESAFVSSPYPVILSLEMHLSKGQQEKMADYILQILGEQNIYSLKNFVSSQHFASPEDLKWKFIIKGKTDVVYREMQVRKRGTTILSEKLDFFVNEEEEQDNEVGDQDYDNPLCDDVDEGWHNIETDRMQRSVVNRKAIPEILEVSIKFEDREPHQILSGLEIIVPSKVVKGSQEDQKIKITVVKDKNEIEEQSPPEEEEISSDDEEDQFGQEDQIVDVQNPHLDIDFLEVQDILKRASTKDKRFSIKRFVEEQNLGKIPICSQRLKGVIGMRGRKFKVYKWMKDSMFYDCFSFKEHKIALLRKEFKFQEIVQRNLSTFSRVYPKAHTGSRHYDPLPWWIAGAQLVSLNFQKIDDFLLLNDAMFERNKRCGYILKPLIYEEQISTSCKRLKVNIISGQQLFKGTEGKQMKLVSASSKKPYVHLMLKGYKQDNIKFTTRAGQNVFNPIWKEEFQFLINFPDYAFLHFKITQESNIHSKLIAQRIVAVRNIRTGLRAVPLLDEKLKRIPYSYLLVFVSYA